MQDIEEIKKSVNQTREILERCISQLVDREEKLEDVLEAAKKLKIQSRKFVVDNRWKNMNCCQRLIWFINPFNWFCSGFAESTKLWIKI